MVDPPLVSVLLCVRDGEAHVGEALESILGQQFQEWELVVVDDGSRDATGRLLQLVAHHEARVRVVVNPVALGLTRALNVGLDHARGRYIARLDADDLAYPARLGRQVQVLEEHPEVVLVGSQARVRESYGRLREARVPLDDLTIRWTLLFANPFFHSAVMFRRRVRDELTRYDESFEVSQDYALWAWLLARGRGVNLGEPLVTLRRHRASVSVARRAEQEAAALRVMAGLVAELLPEAAWGAAELARLRVLHQEIPDGYDPAVARLCDLAEAFGERWRLVGGDPAGWRGLAVERVLRTVPWAQMPQARRDGLLRRAWSLRPAACLAHLGRRLARRWGAA